MQSALRDLPPAELEQLIKTLIKIVDRVEASVRAGAKSKKEKAAV